uniref:Uncharacterized protein n=1 Tax=Oryza glumipatula TaxID=40148 RepID=A0A0D9Y411_9ORYZ
MFVFLAAAASPPLFFSAASIRFALDYKYPLPRRGGAETRDIGTYHVYLLCLCPPSHRLRSATEQRNK